MKILVSVLLILSLCLCFCACGGADSQTATSSASSQTQSNDASSTNSSETPSGGNTSTPASSEETSSNETPSFSEADWDAMLKVDNITVKITCEFINGYDEHNNPDGDLYKIAGDKAWYANETFTEPDMVNSMKSIIGIMKSLVTDYSKYDCVEPNKTFKSKETIIFDVEISGEKAKITAENVAVTIENKQPSKITCKMTQEVVDGPTFVINVEFLISDIGTTVIE